ncbi:helix-turn-helix transcriptional regulator [Flammeovirga kamogawensis]|uniref:Helix-turn-helix transcriptional regulator n=1 Tax=Flammeovirga kamogawensis TaxID=373891 RepID=A0ABX8GQ03_9BACT|nr:helix-turn-helix transcriptional regulator [Flammeovirga kamogawensis]MBB6463028.1 AraC-like DNA-binding protein [Flammeovirga kamogawensis]QWG05665.1 helix-turn-helix transcriptional regulator [Flammeovirga kamogawensis]TRX67495.1 helix-turn-helix transcriptional regulator [Flammeovirga kamogawensis]
MFKINSFKEYTAALIEIYGGVEVSNTTIEIDNERCEGIIKKVELEVGLACVVQRYKIKENIKLELDYRSLKEYDYIFGVFTTGDLVKFNETDQEHSVTSSKRNYGIYTSSNHIQIDGNLNKGVDNLVVVFFVTKEFISRKLSKDAAKKLFSSDKFYHYFDDIQELEFYNFLLKKSLKQNYHLLENRLYFQLGALFYLILGEIESLSLNSKINFVNANISDKEVAILFDIKREIIKDLSEKPSIEKISKKVGIHLNKLELMFQSIFGYTIYNYYQYKRLKAAALEIELQKSAIKEIAYDYGFTDMAHFSNTFKKQFGVPPSKYKPSGLR